MDSQGDKNQGSPSPDENWFQKIVNFLFGGDDPERRKKRLLKQIGKDLSKSKYKFYKVKDEQVLPGLAKFFYEIYKTLGPAQTLLQNAETSNAIKSIVIDTHLGEALHEIQDQFDESVIREHAKKMETKELADMVKEQMINYFAGFDQQTVQSINKAYNSILVFTRIAVFDYYFMLKKFSSALQEHVYPEKPVFESINGEYVSEDMKDFLEIVLSIPKDLDWDEILDIIKEYKGLDVVDRNKWKKIINGIMAVAQSGVLVDMIKHIDKDPYFKPTVNIPNERIVEPYLTKIKTQTELTIQQIISEKRHRKVDQLVELVFGGKVYARTKNYTDKANLMFSKKMMGGFIYTEPMNYLKAFLLDFFKKDVREVMDLLLVRGKWTTNVMSQQLSESFHQIMSIATEIVQFDDALGEEGELGVKLRQVMAKADKDKSAVKFLRQLLGEVNDKAKSFINFSASNLVSIGKSLKMVIEDYDKHPHEILLNWKELVSACDYDIKEKMVDIYKKTYYFIQLLQTFMKNNESTS